MSEIKLTVKDQYLHAFLEFLNTLDYVSVKNVANLKKNGKGLPVIENDSDPSKPQVDNFIEPIEEKMDLENLLKEQNYQGPDRNRFKQMVREIAIEEPIVELLSQLTK